MTLHSWKLVAAALAAAFVLQAESKNPLIAEATQAYNAIKGNLLKTAEKMPAESYDFKPTAEIRTFAQLIAHVADSQTRSCSIANGEAKQPTAGSKTSKEDLVAAMKASIEECDKAFAALTDANATEMLKFRNSQRSRLGVLVGNTVHDNEEYGYLAVYMRLKGVVPPSSER